MCNNPVIMSRMLKGFYIFLGTISKMISVIINSFCCISQLGECLGTSHRFSASVLALIC